MPPAFESFWDRAYRDGDHRNHWEPPEVPGELAALVASGRLAPRATALDVGCGSGVEAVYLAESGLDVIALDSSRRALELARDRAETAGVTLDLRCGTVLDPPVEDGAVDLAVDRGCLHGIDREDRPDYAAQLTRVLRPGGLLFLRGARRDDEDQGVLGLVPEELDDLFPPPAFVRGPMEPIELAARAGNLPAYSVLLRRA